LRGLIGNNGKIKVLPVEEAEGGVLLVIDNDVSNWELLTEEYMVSNLF